MPTAVSSNESWAQRHAAWSQIGGLPLKITPGWLDVNRPTGLFDSRTGVSVMAKRVAGQCGAVDGQRQADVDGVGQAVCGAQIKQVEAERQAEPGGDHVVAIDLPVAGRACQVCLGERGLDRADVVEWVAIEGAVVDVLIGDADVEPAAPERLGALREDRAEALLEAHEGVELAVPGEAEGAARRRDRHLRTRHRELRRQVAKLLDDQDLLAALIGAGAVDGGAQRAAEQVGDELVERLAEGAAGDEQGAGGRAAPRAIALTRARVPAARPGWAPVLEPDATAAGAGSPRIAADYGPPPIFQVDCSRTSTLVKRTSRRTRRPLSASMKRSCRVNETSTSDPCGVTATSVRSTVRSLAVAK